MGKREEEERNKVALPEGGEQRHAFKEKRWR